MADHKCFRTTLLKLGLGSFAFFAVAGCLRQETDINLTVAEVIPRANAVAFLKNVNEPDKEFSMTANCAVEDSAAILRVSLNNGLFDLGKDPNAQQAIRVPFNALTARFGNAKGNITSGLYYDGISYSCLLWSKPVSGDSRKRANDTATALASLGATIDENWF